ncbi:MAG: RNA polymerase sigma factor [Kiloniellales bacterium]
MDAWPLITQLLPDLRAYARTLADTAQDAEDLVGDAIERTIRSDTYPRELASLRPWMFRTIRNLAFDELRKRRVRREYAAGLARLEGAGQTQGLSVEDSALVRRAFEGLNGREREILFLVDVMGFSYAEAASVLEVPKGTVMSRLSRARRAFIERVDPTRKGDKSVQGKQT